MKLTSRERVMLIVLGILLVLAGSYYFMLKPQLEKIDMLLLDRETIQQKVDEVKKEIASGGALKERFEQEDKNIKEQSVRFYPEIWQPKLIVILDGLIKDSGIDVSSIAFTPRTLSAVGEPEISIPFFHPLEPLTEAYKLMTGTATTQGAIDLVNNLASVVSATSGAAVQAAPGNTTQGAISTTTEIMTVSLTYSKTSYEQVTAFIKALEALNRTIVINSLNMAGTESNELGGTVNITFYALPKLHDQDAEYLGWTYDNVYGKDNPFK